MAQIPVGATSQRDATATATAAGVPIVDLINAVAVETNEQLVAGMGQDWRQMNAAHANFLLRLAESNKREMFRDDGATSPEAWTAEVFGLSVATARSFCHVADKAQPLPHLVGSLRAGEISFDKVRAVVDVATPRTDRALCAQATELSVRELAEVAQSTAERARAASPSSSLSRSEHDSRYVRFNDGHRTVSVRLPRDSYAQTKACVDAWAETVVCAEKMPLDQRRCDGLMAMVGSATSGTGPSGGASGANPFWVVAHVPLEDLVEGSGQPSDLAGELEHGWPDRPRDGAAPRL